MVSSRSVASASASTSGRSDRAVVSRSFMLQGFVQRCSALCDAEPLVDVGADPGDRIASLRQQVGERVPHVEHVVPELERHVDAGRLRPLGEPRRVVEQQLARADLQQQRRQARQIREQRGGRRRSPIDLTEVRIGHEGEGRGADHRIRVAVRLEARPRQGQVGPGAEADRGPPASARRGRGARRGLRAPARRRRSHRQSAMASGAWPAEMAKRYAATASSTAAGNGCSGASR